MSETTTTTFGTVTRNADGTTRVHGTGRQLCAWATQPDASWPVSQLKFLDEIVAGFDASGDLVALSADIDIPGDELFAWTSEVLVRAGYPNHSAIRSAV